MADVSVEDPDVEQRAALEALAPEMEAATFSLLDTLTPKQKSRAIAHLQGKTAAEIAAAEGVSRQAVEKTLTSAALQRSVRDMIRQSVFPDKRNKGSEERWIDPVEGAIHTLIRVMMDAKKAVVHGGEVTMVDDNTLRFQAACKLIDLYEPRATSSPTPIAAPPAPAAVVESVEVEETTTQRVRATRKSGA